MKYKFKKGDVVIMTRHSRYIRKGTIAIIDEDGSSVPYVLSQTPYNDYLRPAIKEQNAELVTFKLYINLCK